MATLAGLLMQVKDLLDDSSILDVIVTSYLNDAQRELAQLSRAITVWSVDVAAGAQTVDRPEDVLMVKDVYFDYGTTRYRLDLMYGIPPETPSVTGYPERVYVVGEKLYLHPVPSSSGTLQVVGVAKPQDMSAGTDTPSVKDADSVLVAYAAWMTALASGNNRAKDFENLYKERRMEWSILDAQANPMPTQLMREWPW